MTIHAAILARAAAHAGLTALIGGRIYALQLPQNPTLPAVVFQRVGEGPRESASGADPAQRHALVQFNSWAETFDDARATSDQVRSAFSRLRGTFAGTVIEDSFVENEIDEYDQETQDSRVITDILLHYEGVDG